ncbi:transcriptional regulator [Limosilactobacillus mucosae]|uniref:transcriptional regulator n=1 Tax=Limosilactobacillus mucosae TaxID=97478 RepID=UPI000EC40AB8|nr:transcriptional regulator [Limosilactobacillus mucosae]HAM87141.1 transcriptional regulator [Lactobacillus sp.]
MARKNYWELIKVVLVNSSAQDWEKAKQEWTIIDFQIDETVSSTCVCKKEELKYLYTIYNTITGKKLFPIGSVCIKKFEVEELNQQMSYWQQLVELESLAVEYGKDKTIDFFDDKDHFSRKLIHYLEELEIIDRQQRRFLINMFNARDNPTNGQKRYAWVIVNKYIYPGLRKVYCDIRDKNVTRYLEAASAIKEYFLNRFLIFFRYSTIEKIYLIYIINI